MRETAAYCLNKSDAKFEKCNKASIFQNKLGLWVMTLEGPAGPG